jgi:hypothetical protein
VRRTEDRYPRSFVVPVLVIVGVVLGGCASMIARSKVRKQAAFDHDCPAERVKIAKEDTSIWAYRLNVCGKERKYRDLGNEREFQFVDVTDGVPAIRRKE